MVWIANVPAYSTALYAGRVTVDLGMKRFGLEAFHTPSFLPLFPGLGKDLSFFFSPFQCFFYDGQS